MTSTSKITAPQATKELPASITASFYVLFFGGVVGLFLCPPHLWNPYFWCAQVLSIPLFAYCAVRLAVHIRKKFLLQTDRSLRCAIAVLFTIASFLDGPILLDAINVWFSPNSVQSVVLNGHLRVTHGRGGTSASVVADDKVGAIAFGHNVRSVALEAFEYPLRASSDAATPLSVRVNIHQGFFGRPFVVSHELVSGRRK